MRHIGVHITRINGSAADLPLPAYATGHSAGMDLRAAVEGDLVIVQVGGVPKACLIAFDKRTGLQRWAALDDPTSYSSPVVVEQAGRRVLVCLTGTSLSGLDPATGALLWQHRWDHTSPRG